MDSRALRIIDANGNRTREALRVIEDVARFCRTDAALTARLKRERHSIAKACDSILRKDLKGLEARDTLTDPGRDSRPRSEVTRGGWVDILISNFRRAEEGLRVLEEVSKLVDPNISRRFKRSRFRVYELERAFLSTAERTREGH
jgi:thiamine-phosphate pyrophosphorylase